MGGSASEWSELSGRRELSPGVYKPIPSVSRGSIFSPTFRLSSISTLSLPSYQKSSREGRNIFHGRVGKRVERAFGEGVDLLSNSSCRTRHCSARPGYPCAVCYVPDPLRSVESAVSLARPGYPCAVSPTSTTLPSKKFAPRKKHVPWEGRQASGASFPGRDLPVELVVSDASLQC